MNDLTLADDDPLSSRSRTLRQIAQGLLATLERRDLENIEEGAWKLAYSSMEGDIRLREIVSVGAIEAAAAVLTAKAISANHLKSCPFLRLYHTDGERCRIFVGSPGTLGMTSGPVDFLCSTLSAAASGLRFSDDSGSLSRQYPEVYDAICDAPAVRVLTGIPGDSLSAGPVDFSRLLEAVGYKPFVIAMVSAPLERSEVDGAMDQARMLMDEIYQFARVQLSQSHSEGSSRNQTIPPANTLGDQTFPLLLALSCFMSLANMSVFGQAISNAATILHGEQRMKAHFSTANEGNNESQSRTIGIDVRNTAADACLDLIQKWIQRLEAGRTSGLWTVYTAIFAEDDATVDEVARVLKALTAGDSSPEPLRILNLGPEVNGLVRAAVLSGDVPRVRAQGWGYERHPLGSVMTTLGSLLTSGELAHLWALPYGGSPGICVREPARFSLYVPPAQHPVFLGHTADGSGQQIGICSIDLNHLTRHTAVFGLIGGGKTTTCMQLLTAVYEAGHGIPFLVIEPVKSEYRRLRGHPSILSKLSVYGIADPGVLPLRLNPFDWAPEFPLERHIDYLKSVFCAAFAMYPGMDFVLAEALRDVYIDYGWDPETSANEALDPYADPVIRSALLPTLDDLYEKIEEVLNRRNYGKEIHQNIGAALRARVHSLRTGTKGSLLNTRNGLTCEDLFTAPTVIELKGLSDDEDKAFVMGLLFVLLGEYAETRRRSWDIDERLRHLTLIEEAHRLLRGVSHDSGAESAQPRQKAMQLFTDMMAEMRAYGEGIIVADQSPTALTPEVLKNSSTKIVHQLTTADDRLSIGSTMNLTPIQASAVNDLLQGEAIVHSESIRPAVKIRVVNAKAEIRQTAHENISEMDRHARRHGLCGSCPSPCRFYKTAVNRKGFTELRMEQAARMMIGQPVDLSDLDNEDRCALVNATYRLIHYLIAGSVAPSPQARIKIEGMAKACHFWPWTPTFFDMRMHEQLTRTGFLKSNQVKELLCERISDHEAMPRISNFIKSKINTLKTEEQRLLFLSELSSMLGPLFLATFEEEEIALLILSRLQFPSAAHEQVRLDLTAWIEDKRNQSVRTESTVKTAIRPLP